MAHLTDKVADFFYGELPVSEMADARRHIAECADCRADVQQFEMTHLALKALPDLDPPRRIVFPPPQRRPWSSVLDWRVLTPLTAAAAALIIAIGVALSPAPGPLTVSAPGPAPLLVQAQQVDYDRIVKEVRQSERGWLAVELEKRDREIRQLQGQLAYYESYQRTIRKETLENEASIQLLAKRTESQD